MESEYRGVSNLTGMIALGRVFMCKPHETLKNWTHSGVLSSPDAAAECQNGFSSRTPKSPAELWIFHRCGAARGGESTVIE